MFVSGIASISLAHKQTVQENNRPASSIFYTRVRETEKNACAALKVSFEHSGTEKQ